MKPYDFLVVGSGLFGSTFAYRASRAGKRVIVIDKRATVGGNVYCDNIEGISVHKYGAHIFHTSNKQIWDFVNSIVPFNRYTNCPLANYRGELYNLPFNMNTFHQMWNVVTPFEAEMKIKEQRHLAEKKMRDDGVAEPRNLEEQALMLVGEDIYRKLVKGYTEKQWGRECRDLPAFIIRRLPVRYVYDNNYFNDCYQGIPVDGYNAFVSGLLDGIEVVTETDFFADRLKWESVADRIVYSGKIDEFYGYRFGKLDYRTVRFETEVLNVPNYQGNAVVNYTDRDVPFTRIIEHKHFAMFGNDVYSNPKTVISKEFSVEWADGLEPFYPINDSRNSELYMKYKQLAERETNVYFGGRLAEYKYYDMAPTIEKAFSLADMVL